MRELSNRPNACGMPGPGHVLSTVAVDQFGWNRGIQEHNVLSNIVDLLYLVLFRLGTESEGSHAGEHGSNVHGKLGRLAYHVTHKLADVVARLNDWQRTLDDMLQVSTRDQ